MMKLRYKIISYSSEDLPSPASNLIANSGAWESARFCEFPQQVTIQFYQPITIESIMIVSHPSKIPAKVNILFCLPEKKQLDVFYRFQKYGYIEFGDNSHSDYRLREVKKIQNIGKNAQYMRLILWKNHQNSYNFFNQVGLSQIVVHGTPYTYGSTLPSLDNRSILNNLTSSQYIQAKVELLDQFKQEFSKQDDFQSAKQVKQIIKAIKKEGQKMKELQQKKREAVGRQEYQNAKSLKASIEQLRKDIEYMANNFYDPNKKTIRPVLKDSRFKGKMQEIMGMTSNKSSLQGSRISTKLKKAELQILGEEKQSISQHEEDYNDAEDQDDDEGQTMTRKSRISYENQIVPAVLHKNKKDLKSLLNSGENLQDAAYQDNQFIEKYTKNDEENLEPQDMTPSAQANASVLFDFYDRQIVKKLHSKHWNFKHQAINHIAEQTGQAVKGGSQLDKNRVRAALFVFNRCIKEGSLPILSVTMDMFSNFITNTKNTDSSKAQQIKLELHSQIEKSVNELFLKMSENTKVKNKAQQILKNMYESQIFGVSVVYHSIVRSYFNPTLTHNTKIKKYKLKSIQQMIATHGIGGNKNGVPIHSIDFVAKAAEDQVQEVRKQATIVLKLMQDKGEREKVIEVLRNRQGVKTSIMKQLSA